MRYCTLDLETDGRRTYNRFCNPLDYNNDEHRIVMLQYKFPKQPAKAIYFDKKPERLDLSFLQNIDLLIGQNIKFDLLWLWREPDLQAFIAKGGRIWDTQVAEYLLCGQEDKSYSLDTLATQYGGTVKNDLVSSAFAEGKLFSSIDKTMAVRYGKEDVINTELIFTGQFQKAKQKKMLPIISLWMGRLLAVTDMEHNGLVVDKEELFRQSTALKQEQEELEKRIIKTVFDAALWPQHVEFNLQSSQHISLVLFGGSIKFIAKIPVGVFKTGKRIGEAKFKNEDQIAKVKGLGFTALSEWETNTTGIFQTNNKVLSTLKTMTKEDTIINQFVSDILDSRTHSKLLSSYYTTLPTMLHDHDGAIHSEFIICPRRGADFSERPPRTGRLSSRNPNVQNLPKTLLGVFNSRFDQGSIIEADYSQIEVRVAAWLSEDPVLINEINSGIDMHLANASWIYNITEADVTPEQRKFAKALTFGILYGQGQNKMADLYQVTTDVARDFINRFYAKYQGLHALHTKLVKEVKEKREVFDGVGYSSWRSPFGLWFLFTEQDSPEFLQKKGVLKSFNPPDIKNYPVQGCAQIVVAAAEYLLFREFYGNNDIKLINTVHDAILFDCARQEDMYCSKIKTIMENKVPEILEKGFKNRCPVPLTVDIKRGTTWLNAKEN